MSRSEMEAMRSSSSFVADVVVVLTNANDCKFYDGSQWIFTADRTELDGPVCFYTQPS